MARSSLQRPNQPVEQVPLAPAGSVEGLLQTLAQPGHALEFGDSLRGREARGGAEPLLDLVGQRPPRQLLSLLRQFLMPLPDLAHVHESHVLLLDLLWLLQLRRVQLWRKIDN
eukprot:3046686-Rhodomonas_salina.1